MNNSLKTKILHHAANIGATFAGALGTAICVPMLVFNLVAFPEGSLARPVEVAKYGTGSALCGAFLLAGYRRKFVKDKPSQASAPAPAAEPPSFG